MLLPVLYTYYDSFTDVTSFTQVQPYFQQSRTSNDDVFNGQWILRLNDKHDGQLRKVWANGEVYYGECSEGKPNGIGKQNFGNGKHL